MGSKTRSSRIAMYKITKEPTGQLPFPVIQITKESETLSAQSQRNTRGKSPIAELSLQESKGNPQG